MSITALISCILVFTAFGLIGCSTKFAEKEYDSDKAIATSDRNIKVGTVSSHKNGAYSFSASKFDGRETVWKNPLTAEKDVSIVISLSLKKGKAKVVYIDDSKNVTTLIGCTPETSLDDSITQSLTMKKGNNGFKIVGYDCKDLKLKLQIIE